MNMLDMAAIFAEHREVMATLDNMIPQLQHCAEIITKNIQAGGTVFWMGNGGSAADAQHMAAELIGRFKKERRALPSIALTTDSSVLTCLSNDYDFNIIFARQLEALCNNNDIVIGLSTSGNSENVLRGMAVARQRGAFTIGFTGQTGGKLIEVVDVCFAVSSHTTARIQEAHSLLCHTLCEAVELHF
jgi:D-sedoheptulose 7-phosphate isomerase